jgi:endonuclease/exonuclease/phosphatase family metal-dependent hydrolase
MGWADLTVGIGVRVVTTHLERFDPAIQIAQPAELLGGPATPLRVVILRDLNSAPGRAACRASRTRALRLHTARRDTRTVEAPHAHVRS